MITYLILSDHRKQCQKGVNFYKLAFSLTPEELKVRYLWTFGTKFLFLKIVSNNSEVSRAVLLKVGCDQVESDGKGKGIIDILYLSEI